MNYCNAVTFYYRGTSMTLKNKILIILSLCLLLCIGAYFIISRTFANFEKQLFEKCRIEALVGGRVMSEIIDMMIDTRLLTKQQIFDRNYVPIQGSNPQKFRTQYDAVFDKYIQKIEDEFLKDEDLEFAVLVDINGYLPTHNSKYAKSETSDPDHNLNYSRSKRIFNDRVGLKASRFIGPGTLKQLYNRDTGEVMWDISSPVFAKGEHFGAFRLGVSLKHINELKNQMIIIVGMTILVILSITMLMLFLILPRKLYDTDLDIPQY